MEWRTCGGVGGNSAADASALHIASDLCVYEKCMVATVPGDVHEANDVVIHGSYDPTQAVRADAVSPASLRVASLKVDERNHLRVADRSAPLVLDPCHYP